MVEAQDRGRGRRWWLLRAALLVNLSLALGYIGLWTIAAQQELFWRADFTNFYTGWTMVREGQGGRLYDLGLQEQYQRQILEGRSFRDGLLPYVNPPHMTLPFVLLAWLPRQTAYYVWTAGQVALLAWLLRLLWTLARSWSVPERLIMLVTVVAFPPMLGNFLLGAFTLLVLVCVVHIYSALRRGAEAWAGVWLAVGTIKMHLVLWPGLVLLAAWRWRPLAAAALTCGGLALLTVFGLGLSVWGDYAQVLLFHSGAFGRFGIEPASMYTIKGTLTLLLGDERGALISVVSTGVLMVTALALALLWRGPWRPQAPDFDARLALTLVVGLLVTTHLNAHDALLVVLPAFLFYRYLRERDRSTRAYAAFVLSCPLLFLVSEAAIGASLGVRVPFLAMLVLAGWIAWALVRDRALMPAETPRLGTEVAAGESERVGRAW